VERLTGTHFLAGLGTFPLCCDVKTDVGPFEVCLCSQYQQLSPGKGCKIHVDETFH